jgi:hypothetical protein
VQDNADATADVGFPVVVSVGGIAKLATEIIGGI